MPVQVNSEYFNNQNVPADDEYSNYQQVKSTALLGGATLTDGNVFDIATTFISAARLSGARPEAVNDNCIWEFDTGRFDSEATETKVTVVASQSGDRTFWEVVISGDIGDQNVSNFTFLNGYTSNNGSSGEWRGFDPDNSNSEASLYTWNQDNDGVYQLLFEIDAGDDTIVAYERGIESNRMSYFNGQNEFSIFWNEGDDTGWIDEDKDTKKCYADFLNAPC